jgi:hypothetical protein
VLHTIINTGRVQTNTTLMCYCWGLVFIWHILGTTPCFGLSLGHHQVDHLFLMRQLYNVQCPWHCAISLTLHIVALCKIWGFQHCCWRFKSCRMLQCHCGSGVLKVQGGQMSSVKMFGVQSRIALQVLLWSFVTERWEKQMIVGNRRLSLLTLLSFLQVCWNLGA